MLVLLPPSEGKRSGGAGPPLDLDALSWPELGTTRRRVGDALVGVCTRQPARARRLLGLSDALDADRAANEQLWQSPTMPAGMRYAGVVHDNLGYPTLPAAARRRADRHLVTLSGLWGATRPRDEIPAYRIGISTRLPRVGPLPALWRGPLHRALDSLVAEQGALDLRSTGYLQMYRPSPEHHERLTPVRVTGPDGRRAAPSHQSKLVKGRLVRAVLLAGAPSAETAAAAAEALGLSADASASGLVVRAPVGWGLIGGSGPR